MATATIERLGLPQWAAPKPRLVSGMGDRALHYVLYPRKLWESDQSLRYLRQDPSLRVRLPQFCIDRIYQSIETIPPVYPSQATEILDRFQPKNHDNVLAAVQDLDDIMCDMLTNPRISQLGAKVLATTQASLRAEGLMIEQFGNLR